MAIQLNDLTKKTALDIIALQTKGSYSMNEF